MKIVNRWTNACLWEGEAETVKDAVETAVKSGANLSGADLRNADLRDADLGGADLRDADLRSAYLGGANLRDADLGNAKLRGADLGSAYLGGANLRGADLGGADLRGADLGGADLRDADLGGADLRGADLGGADLRGADLMATKADFWEVLVHAIPEIPALIAALNEGRVDGSTYEGECACLVGTVANVRRCYYESIPGIAPDASRPAEEFFMAIRRGDTPATNQCSKLAVEWAQEFLRLVRPEAVA